MSFIDDILGDMTNELICQMCGRPTPVNIRYPITQVTCFQCRAEQVEKSIKNNTNF